MQRPFIVSFAGEDPAYMPTALTGVLSIANSNVSIIVGVLPLKNVPAAQK